MQINGGRNDGFVAWGDSGGHGDGPLRRDGQDTCGLWQIAREFTLCDNFFMAAFGGSYLNHQFLISGRTPEFFNACGDAGKEEDRRAGRRPARRAPGRGPGLAEVGAGGQAEVRQQRRHHAGRLRGQHHGPALPAELGAPGAGRRRHAGRPAGPVRAAAAKLRHHRRPAVRASASAGPGMAAPGRRRWTAAANGVAPELPVPPPAVQLLQAVRAGHGRARSSTCATAAWATARSRTSSSPTSMAGTLPAVTLLQAAGQPEPACRLLGHRVGRRATSPT